jgi:choline dehydrogenase-like flavoprotein
MSSTEDNGVVDSMGKVWGKQGLYVADSSVLPSASGVNPMITTLALADWISRGLVKEMAT